MIFLRCVSFPGRVLVFGLDTRYVCFMGFWARVDLLEGFLSLGGAPVNGGPSWGLESDSYRPGGSPGGRPSDRTRTAPSGHN